MPIQEDRRAKNTTFIFAGLFSVVTSAFIVQVGSQIQLDPNDETASLLRVVLCKIDNTTFRGKVPTIPQWTGPPFTTVQVQAIFFATLTISAFLAMLGKQKLGGVVVWYFDHVTGSYSVARSLVIFGRPTSLGVTFYLFIVIAGTASEGCPYRTPFAHIFRHIFRNLHEHFPTFRSAPAVISNAVSSNFSKPPTPVVRSLTGG